MSVDPILYALNAKTNTNTTQIAISAILIDFLMGISVLSCKSSLLYSMPLKKKSTYCKHFYICFPLKTVLLVNKLNVRILISDDGIGIFKKIQQFFAEQGEDLTLDEAVDALFPGKLTTAKKNHTGEGIFFSSRTADQFVIISDNKCFRHDSFSDIKFELENVLYTSGTCVAFSMNNNSTKQLKDVFNMFSDPERGFFKTQIPIAHMFDSGCPVSRSEARRLGSYVNRFEEVTLDFKDVTSIGQAFTHELFIVFQNNNPSMKFNVVNANTDVANMISRVKNTK